MSWHVDSRILVKTKSESVSLRDTDSAPNFRLKGRDPLFPGPKGPGHIPPRNSSVSALKVKAGAHPGSIHCVLPVPKAVKKVVRVH